jgi:NitT/TauT family transport system substrate-binding protein
MGRRLALLTAIVCSLGIVGVVGCGGDDESGGSTEAAKPATVKVGTIPIADVAPLYLGIKQGFFTAEKLDVQPQLAEGGAAIVPAVLSGSDQIGFSNVTSLLIAASKDLPVTIISQGVLAGEDETKAFDALLVPKDSKITDLKQLEGKTVAVNNLNNVGPLTINTALKANGVDYKKIKYIEVPFPDMPAALDSGRVPAAWMVEPFVSQVKAAGGKTLATPFEQTAPNLTIATYFTSKKYAQENPDVIQRFARAMNKSLDYAQTHPDEVRQIVTTYTKIPPEAAEKMSLPTWKADLNQPTIEKTAQLAQEYGFLKEAPAIDELIYKAK